jgi:hypothetical protein
MEVMRAEAARRWPMIVLAYLGPLAIIPLVIGRRDGDERWHAWHGLLLACLGLAVVGGLAAAAGLTALSSPTGGVTLGAIAWIFWIAALAVQLTAMLTALNGGRLMIPLVSALASKIDSGVDSRLASIGNRSGR